MSESGDFVFIPPRAPQQPPATPGTPAPTVDSATHAAPLGDTAAEPVSAPTTAPTPEGPSERGLVSLASSAGEHERIARSRGWSFYDLDANSETLDEEIISLLEPATARKLQAVPVELKGQRVTVAVADPNDFALATQIRQALAPRTARLHYANPAAIKRHLSRHYSASEEAGKIGEESNRARSVAAVQAAQAAATTGRVEGGESANTAMMRLIIEQAISEGASDIHIEPTETKLEVRYRVDGKLRLVSEFPSPVTMGLITYIKVQAKMKSDNFMIPDSGVMYYKPDSGKAIDIRVETAPTTWGSSAVMRLQAEIWRDLSTLGFAPDNERRFRTAIAQPFGIVLVTGPTGSGKSTTLYSAIREKIDPSTKIITLENPVEYKIGAGVTQMSISDEQGMTFAKGLRSILRQDPDTVLIGEIRDEETAETAVDAAMTGHLVFSTLHTNDAPGVVPRLIRMGIEPFMVASALLAVVAQRLVRRVCGTCRIQADPDPDAWAQMGFDIPAQLPEFVYEANAEGCENCVAGYKGRVPIHEVMVINAALSEAIADNLPFSVIVKTAREGGMTTMREDGFLKALQGLTTVAEVAANTLSDIT